MQVMDVGHVDGVLEHRPVTALELDLAIHRPPPEARAEPHCSACDCQNEHPKYGHDTAASSRRAADGTLHERVRDEPYVRHTYLGSSSSGTNGIGGRTSIGMCLLPLNSHTKPPFSTTSYADITGSFGQSPCYAMSP